MTNLQTINQRLENLETRLRKRDTQLRHHRIILAGVALATPLLLLSGAGDIRFETIQLSRLEIVDEEGNVAMALSAGDKGGQFDIWNSSSRNVMRLSSNEHGGDLAIWNTEGKSVAGAWATSNGGAIATWNGKGQKAARLEGTDDHGFLSLFGTSPEPMLQLRGEPDGGRVVLLDANGNDGFLVEPTSSGMSMSLFPNEGMDRLSMTADDNGSHISLSSLGGGVYIKSDAVESTPGMVILNSNGHTAVRTGLRPEGGGQLQVRSATGETVGMLRSDQSGNGRLDLGNNDGNMLITMQIPPERGPTLALISPWGKSMCVLAGTEEGGVINLMNRNGVPVVTSGTAGNRRGGSMTIQNQRGMTVVSAGSDEQSSGQLRLHAADGKTREVLPPRK